MTKPSSHKLTKFIVYSSFILGLTVGSYLSAVYTKAVEQQQQQKHLLALELGEFNSKSGEFQIKTKQDICAIQAAIGSVGIKVPMPYRDVVSLSDLDNTPEAIQQALKGNSKVVKTR